MRAFEKGALCNSPPPPAFATESVNEKRTQQFYVTNDAIIGK